MATITAVVASPTGTAYTTTAASSNDKFLNTGREVLLVTNGGGGSINVTFTPGGTPGGLALATVVVAVANGASKLIGPFNPAYWNDGSGFVNYAFSGTTSVTEAVIQTP